MLDCVSKLYQMERIQQKRLEMIALGEKYGLCAEETLACSRELDIMINQYLIFSQSDNNRKNSQLPRKMSMWVMSSPNRQPSSSI